MNVERDKSSNADAGDGVSEVLGFDEIYSFASSNGSEASAAG